MVCDAATAPDRWTQLPDGQSCQNGTGVCRQGACVTATARLPDSADEFCDTGGNSASFVPCPTPGDAGYHGQDGDFRVDVPSYAAGAGYVVDSITGLGWTTSSSCASSDGGLTLSNASRYCQGLSTGGFADWHLPSVRELLTLVDFGGGVYPDGGADGVLLPAQFGVHAESCTPVFWTREPAAAPWTVGLQVSLSIKPGTGLNQALCVRGTLPALPMPRFAPVDGGVVQDLLTGLEWQTQPWAYQGDWLTAIYECGQVTLDPGSGWRLPNAKELLSLVDYGSPSAAIVDAGWSLPANSLDFWTSTPLGLNPYAIVYANAASGNVGSAAPATGLSQLCVHGP